MRKSIAVMAAALFCACAGARAASAQTTPLRIIAFGAHPDDNEIRLAGTAAKWAALGHKVKFVSVTNGDIGHWREAGGPLARRRAAESQETARILGITTQVLDIHDGELEPTLENRRTITRLIREWKADIVLGHRPNDYHPDHRAVGQLVQDASYMVTVPFFCPDTPALPHNPVFLSYEDGFTVPNPFRADIVVSIDDVLEKKLAAMEALPSQFYEGGANGGPQLVPSDAAGKARRKQEVRDSFTRRFMSTATQYRAKLRVYYGADAGDKVKAAEAFEISEYGARPNAEEIRRLFPFFGAREAGFTPLFNGKDLTGWVYGTRGGAPNKTGKGYQVDNGVLFTTKEDGGNLFTEKEYSDFVFRFEFKLTENANNGIGIRAPLEGDAAYVGMEIQILDDSGSQYTNLQPAQYHGSVYQMFAAKRGHQKAVGEWNSEEIRAKGRQITVVLNGVTIVDANLDDVKDGQLLAKHRDLGKPEGSRGIANTKGHIGFLGHGARVEFRNIQIKEL